VAIAPIASPKNRLTMDRSCEESEELHCGLLFFQLITLDVHYLQNNIFYDNNYFVDFLIFRVVRNNI